MTLTNFSQVSWLSASVVAGLALCAVANSQASATPLVQIQTVLVGDVGNQADNVVMPDGTSGYGRVDYEYRIGKYEITAGEYCSFLNAVAKTDPFGLYLAEMGSQTEVRSIVRAGTDGNYTYSLLPGQELKPISFVTWFNAARFCNWLHNGAAVGSDTESGAYNLRGATSGTQFFHTPNARYRLPTEDEWYKASFYDPAKAAGAGGYWSYANRSDSMNTSQANYLFAHLDSFGSYLTEVGRFSNAVSYYGTYDQGGNLWEWTEAVINNSLRGMRGGSYTEIDGGGQTFYNTGHFGGSPSYAPPGENGFNGWANGFRIVEMPDSDGDGLTDAWERGYGRYQIVQGNFTWEQAKADAQARGGHLATVTSAAENTFIAGLNNQLAWLGATDREQEGSWQWVTGELFSYANWYSGADGQEPDNHLGQQHFLITHFNGNDVWGDERNDDPNIDAYVLEFGYPTDPFNADTDGDGFNDRIESDAASDPNDAASVPSFADSDGDGVTNYRETQDGTDPNDPNSFNPLSKGLVAYYPFDGTAIDESGFQETAKLSVNATYVPRDAGLRKALKIVGEGFFFRENVAEIPSLDKSNAGEFVEIPEPALDDRGVFTASIWVNEEGMSNEAGEAYITAGYSGESLMLVGNYYLFGGGSALSTQRALTFESSLYQDLASPVELSEIQSFWINYTVVSDGATISLFKNGVRIHSGDCAAKPRGNWSIGRHWWDNGDTFSTRFIGSVSDFRIYNRALSASEVEQLYFSEAAVIFVDATATGAADGSSWQDAYTDLQVALATSQPGSQIWVAKGTYKPSSSGDRNASFALKSGVTLHGGFAGTETSPLQRDVAANPTILSGDLLGNDSGEPSYSNQTRSDNSTHLLVAQNLTDVAVLDGITVQDAHTDSRDLNTAFANAGGGLFVSNSKLLLRSCVFQKNFSVTSASLWDSGDSDITIEGCLFRNNRSERGASVHLAAAFVIRNSAFVGNRTQNSPSGYMWGGGLFVSEGVGIVANTIFANNYAGEDGGAVYTHGNTTFLNCTFIGNESATTGTAVMDREKEAIFQNCIFWGNFGGQGLVGWPGAGLVIASADPYGGPASISLGGPAKNSIVQGGYAAPGSVNIISTDPAFYSATNPLGADGVLGTSDDGLQVMGWSPALEAGDNSFVPADITTDIAGASRIVGTVDLGAYEGAKVLEPNGDEDGDGIRNGAETNSGVYTSASDTGTNPLKTDTDGDGLADGVETASYIYIDATDTGTNPNIADSDGDGLNDGAETNTGVFAGPADTGTNPLEADSSGDGLLDGDVVSAGYDPNTSYTALFNLIKTKGLATQEGVGLFSESAMMDLNLGGVTLRRSGSTVNLRLQIQSKMNLSDALWHNEGTETFILDMPGNKAFLRIRALGPQ